MNNFDMRLDFSSDIFSASILDGWGGDILLPNHMQKLFEQSHRCPELHQILKQRDLHAHFQPIVDLNNVHIYGYEGLIRGPVASALHAPLALFAEAAIHQVSHQIEHLSRQVVLESFAQHRCANKLFLNVSPGLLLHTQQEGNATRRYIDKLGLDPHNIIIELTESAPCPNYQQIFKAAEYYRNMGFEIAMDDLGEGFSSLRLWSELAPDYVKIDKHFISGINNDQVKYEFVRSLQQIALNSGTKVIAEGIETEAELHVIKDLKIAYGQGYLFGKPAAALAQQVPQALQGILQKNVVRVHSALTMTASSLSTVGKLIKHIPSIPLDVSNEYVYKWFEKHPDVYALPVVDKAVPVGLISRYSMIDGLARPYRHELYGKRSCDTFMDKKPLVVEKTMSLQALSGLITDMEPHHLSNGFIITHNGKYLGMGSGHDLLREITKMQIDAARYANPLTMLPGNVPISEHMDRLLQAGVLFHACYCDLDSFKPFNDAYGFRRGDELIQFVGGLLSQGSVAELDFVGHVGGDDFIVLFQSEDWEQRCQAILTDLASAMPSFYDAEDQARGGIESEDRAGNKVFYPFVSLSIGAVSVDPKRYPSHHEISSATAHAKKQAKKILGNSLFLERRTIKPL
jgi:diguanylate cyclase (GGDEF)-like protein